MQFVLNLPLGVGALSYQLCGGRKGREQQLILVGVPRHLLRGSSLLCFVMLPVIKSTVLIWVFVVLCFVWIF